MDAAWWLFACGMIALLFTIIFVFCAIEYIKDRCITRKHAILPLVVDYVNAQPN